MASQRRPKGKTIPGIEESFLGTKTSSNLSRKGRTSKLVKRKSQDVITSSEKERKSLRIKKRASSDPVLPAQSRDDNLLHNSANLKIEAFDFFHHMLNRCCGSQMFNVSGTASILKQFTPDIMKTVIYVIAENSKRVPLEQANMNSQGQNDEVHDMEISNITTKAKLKRVDGKWQPVPELVQPRLTSPGSNSCSPVSAAVQALMSFARNEKSRNNQAEEIEVKGTFENSSTEIHAPQESELQKPGNLNEFESGSLAAVSSSPFLQPASSSLMLHAEVTKSQSASDILSRKSGKELNSSAPVLQRVSTAFARPTSPSFPWMKLPSKNETLERGNSRRKADRHLPSISSILAPIGSSYSDLNFQGIQMPGIAQAFGQAKSTSASIETYTCDDSKAAIKQLPSPVGVIVPGTLASRGGSRKSQGSTESKSSLHRPAKTNKRSARIAISATSCISDTGEADNGNQASSKVVFRKILPKPNEKNVSIVSGAKQVAELASPNAVKSVLLDQSLEKNEVLLNRNVKTDSETTQSSTGSFNLQENTNLSIVKRVSNPDTLNAEEAIQSLVTSDSMSAIEPEEKRACHLSQPLVSVISNIREQGFVIKGLPSEQGTSQSAVRPKKTGNSNSGKLEVASALLSMGSSENETKKSGKVVSSFNREKATFDIKESASAQRGDILFTKTGTFQIEDIEIDPKKNKIEKDSYECGKCGRVFTSLVYLARHIKRVCPDMTLRKWKCDRCEKAFRHPFGLQQHVYTHTGERPFKCDQCAKAFYSANDLRRHTRTHSGERPYTCSHCNKCFSTTISLKTHTYIHTGERPHKCPYCPKTFATSSKLSRHVVTHSDRRPYACDICTKTFNRSGDLRRHYNKVHNLKHDLLSCDQCNKLFATQKCLQNHKETHNRNLKVTPENITESADGVKFSKLIPENYVLKADVDE